MTSNEIASRGQLHAFQWAPCCLRVLRATDTFIALVGCRTTDRLAPNMYERTSWQRAQSEPGSDESTAPVKQSIPLF